MYAVIETGGKQYNVRTGDVLYIEKLPGEAGDVVSFDKILLIGKEDHVFLGHPQVEDSKVEAEIIKHGRGEKLIVFKFKRRKNYRRKQGHRQDYTEIRISNIQAPNA